MPQQTAPSPSRGGPGWGGGRYAVYKPSNYNQLRQTHPLTTFSNPSVFGLGDLFLCAGKVQNDVVPYFHSASQKMPIVLANPRIQRMLRSVGMSKR
jgi:hypothetical protein